jgi:hypothetical protein
MTIEKEQRWNEQRWGYDTKHELWLSDYDKYVLGDEIQMRIFQIKATRDKCGISPDDKDAEPNRHIESLLNICKQLEIEISDSLLDK